MTAEQAASHGDPTLTGKPYKSSGGKMTHNKTLNHDEQFKYSKGGTINIVKYEGRFLAITAEHVLNQPDRDW